MLQRSVLVCACLIMACAPMSTTQRIHEKPRPSRVARGAPVHGAAQLAVAVAGETIVVSSSEPLTCSEQRIKVVERTAVRRRSVNKPITVFEYVLGLTFGGAGAYAFIAPQSVIDETTTTEPIRNAGAISAGIGALFLTFAVINTFRGGVSHKNLGTQERLEPPGPAVACGSAPRSGDSLALAIGGTSRPLGTTDASGSLTIAFDAITAEMFDGDWKAATVVGPAGSAPVDLSPARSAVAAREWTALAAAPSLDAARTFRKRFGSDDKIDALLAQLADPVYAPTVDQAIEAGDAGAAKTALASWLADAPNSTVAAAKLSDVSELNRSGPAEFFYARFEAASSAAGSNPKRFADAERAIITFARVAPTDPRIATANEKLKKQRVAIVAIAKKHSAQARVFAKKKQWAEADAEVAQAKQLAPQDAATLDAIAYVNKKKTAAGVRIEVAAVDTMTATKTTDTKTTDTKTATKTTDTKTADVKADTKLETTTETKLNPADEKARLAAEAKAKREEQARVAAEAKAEKARVAAEAKAEKARVAAEAKAEKARVAAEAKGKTAEDKARLAEEAKAKREEEARVAAEAKAKAEEDKARLAEEAKAKREEQARLAADAKAKGAEEAARLATERARTAEEKKAAQEQARAAAAETARLAAEGKKRKQAEQKAAAEAARLAAVAERARKAELARAKQGGRQPREVASKDTPPTALAGLWAAALGNSIWLVEMQADGTGKTALWTGGRIAGLRTIRWQLDQNTLSVAAGSSAIRGRATQSASSTLDWLGVEWRKQ